MATTDPQRRQILANEDFMDYVNNLKDLPRTDLNGNQTYVGRSFRGAVVVPWRHASSVKFPTSMVCYIIFYLI